MHTHKYFYIIFHYCKLFRFSSLKIFPQWRICVIVAFLSAVMFVLILKQYFIVSKYGTYSNRKIHSNSLSHLLLASRSITNMCHVKIKRKTLKLYNLKKIKSISSIWFDDKLHHIFKDVVLHGR